MPKKTIKDKGAKQQIEEHFAYAYASLAWSVYNEQGHKDSPALLHFRLGLKLAGLDINPYLPPECPKI